MVPHWSFPNAIALGNALVLKPSEQVPLSAGRIAELLREAGLPDGVFNVVHGGREAAEAILDHPGIEAVSFVGSTPVAKEVYRRGTAALKRVLALGGAKNHVIVMPDADPEMAAGGVLAAMSGCTGQRCMAASVMVAVSATRSHRGASRGAGSRRWCPGGTSGRSSRGRPRSASSAAIAEAEQAGAKVLVDGRNAIVPGREGGFWVGPTVIDYVASRHAHRAGGSLRAGARHRARARPGRGHRGRECLALRQRGVGLHRERRPRAATSWSAPARGWSA